METTNRISGGIVTATGGGTTFSVTAGTGKKVDYTNPAEPTITKVSWGAFSNVTITNIATQPATLIGIDPTTGTVVQHGLPVTPTNLRTYIYLKLIVHTTGVV